MNYKKSLSILMIFAGVSLLILALWSLTGLVTCPEDTADCESWALLGAYMFGPASIGLLIGGVSLYKNMNSWLQLASVFGIAWIIYWWML